MLEHILICGTAVAGCGILSFSNLHSKKFRGTNNYLPVAGWIGNTFQLSKKLQVSAIYMVSDTKACML